MTQRHFEKVEAQRKALQERLDLEAAALRLAQEEARKKVEAEKAAASGKDEEMTDADAPKPETVELSD